MTVACNDTLAFVFGVTMGKTTLITLSPNKTLEGFLGGAISTFVACFILVPILFKNDHMICPYNKFSWIPFENDGSSCDAINRELFDYSERSFFGLFSITCSPAQIATCVFGLFSSLIGPFGGFLASGMKRAYDLKDFAATLPEHGGFIDRFDC
jgi:phosphatidate cytidylyltransferase